MRRLFTLMIVMVLVAACRPSSQNVQGSYNPDPNLVQWDRSPQSIVFRADVIGGDDDFHARNAIPNCTIYGDNRVLWVNELGPFRIQVLEDRLTDAAISAFIQHLTVDERIYTYEAHLSDVQTETSVNPVVETIQVNVNGLEHDSDSLSGWDNDYFPRIVDACQHLSSAPVLVEPSSGWLIVQAVPFSIQPPVVNWDRGATGLSLASEADGSPHWISGATASQIWDTLHSQPSNLLFNEGDSYYEVALQVPGVTRDAPPAPQ
jgi:hypothetical protein